MHEKLAIKKMDIKDVRGFMNEMKVLSSVHHKNLVRLIGYCIKGSLFLAYEYIENGTLSQHLKLGKNGAHVLSWEMRVQIAVDAARGIEYLHDHTTPSYIHRDIKPCNILLDINWHAKVGDFGLTKLIGSDGNSIGTTSTRPGGTFGYIPPEFGKSERVSQKADIYAFGVVLLQLVSGKEAIIRLHNGPHLEVQNLVSMFDGMLTEPDAKEKFLSLVDPALGNNYPVGSVWMMIDLGKRCTIEDPEQRPPIRDVANDLVDLSHPHEDLTTQLLTGSDSSLSVSISL